jgi:dienelactone hydrolase
MLLIHGGGWQDKRGEARRLMSTAALVLHKLGWRVINISYTPGYKPPGAALDPDPMLRDVVAFYDQIRRAYGGPICAYGQSAGGHLAAMLAVERPSLSCAILDGTPVDLTSLVGETDSAGVNFIRRTFGASRSLLGHWSPAADWRRRTDRTAVWITDAEGDPVVPPQQGDVFAAVDPSANVAAIPAGTVWWLHSLVDLGALQSRLQSLFRWLDRFRPQKQNGSAPQGADVGSGCNRQPPHGARWRLMLSGDAWQQIEQVPSGPSGRLIAATRGCSGSAQWQDDGLSVWALPRDGAVLPQGAEASLVLDPGHAISRLSATFRGFLARPQDWRFGLYASTSEGGPIGTPVAACVRGQCSGLRRYDTKLGALIAATGSRGNPDQADQPTPASFALPAGTRRIAWVLQCAASSGCSLNGIANKAQVSPRARDPLGHPAVFSMYRAEVGG